MSEEGRTKKTTTTNDEDGTAAVVVEIDSRSLTTALFAALQPTWIRLAPYVLPLVGVVIAFRLLPNPSTTTLAIVAIAVGVALQFARNLAASQALRRALPSIKERVALGPEAIVRDSVQIAWNEVTDAAEIDHPTQKGEPIRLIAVRARGTWCVVTPVARFVRGDYETARATINAARHVRVVTLR